MNTAKLIKLLLPPLLVNFSRVLYFRCLKFLGLGSRIDYECIPEGWSYIKACPEVKGWDVGDVMEVHKANWERFASLVHGAGPLGISMEGDLALNTDLKQHNTIMTFAYSLTLAARHKDRLSMLDWGGGMGQYYLLAASLLPEVSIEYHCKDLPKMVQCGARLLPEQHFYPDESCLTRTYDFVVASSALHYSQDWRDILARLARTVRSYILITRLPTVICGPSFTFVQRPYNFGYNTEYMGWCLNRGEFFQEAGRIGLQLVREFIIGETPYIFRAPEQCMNRGFLFRPSPIDEASDD